MAKTFKFRLSRVIPSFQSWRAKEQTDAPENHRAPAFCLSPVNPKAFDIDFPAAPPRSSPSPTTLPRYAPVVSVGCNWGSSRSTRRNNADADDSSKARETPAYLWRKEEKWHVVACVESPRRKIDSDDGDIFPPATARKKKKKKKETRRRGKKESRSRARLSTSSDSGWFSSEEEEGNYEREDDYKYEDETETLVSSSKSFSTDSSSEFNPRLKPIYESPDNVFRRNKIKPRRNRKGRAACCPSPETGSPARAVATKSVLRRLVPCAVDGKVKESFAVVKRSDDPYGDFRRSMAEMILEKQMYDTGDLEQLLHCFLSLNSRHHHRAIVAAFSEIWDALFPNTTQFSNIP